MFQLGESSSPPEPERHRPGGMIAKYLACRKENWRNGSRATVVATGRASHGLACVGYREVNLPVASSKQPS